MLHTESITGTSTSTPTTASTKLEPNSPVGWIHLSYTLHELGRSQAAGHPLPTGRSAGGSPPLNFSFRPRM